MHGSRLRSSFGWPKVERNQQVVKQLSSLLLLLLVSLLQVPSTMGKHNTQHSPEILLASVEEEVPVPYLNVFYQDCNLTLYEDTAYKKAWDHAQMNEYAKGAELFNHFISVSRKGRDDKWRQDVCDGWPYSLFECRRHPKLTQYAVCMCLNVPKLTEFEVVEEDIFENGTYKLPVCRVKFGKKCQSKTRVLQCAHEAECVSDVCRTVNLEPSLILVVIFAYFSFRRFI